MKVFSPFLNGNTTTSGSFNVPNHPSTASIQNPLTGSLFHDDTDGMLKIYTGTQWQVVGEQALPVAGPASADIEYLLVAGGGGNPLGGNNGAGNGGGGGGGFISSSYSNVTSGSSFTITIGAGTTTSGDDSTITADTFANQTAIGGGEGGIGRYGGAGSGNDQTGKDGGSGGGGGNATSGDVSGGAATIGQGNTGGSGVSNEYAGGGGGGAGAAGSNAASSTGGNGGDGLQSSITGTSTYYAGGGGGGTYGGTAGTGGAGGGTDGKSYGGGQPSNGIANTGGGAGGLANKALSAPSGGSGVAIFAYPTASISATGGVRTFFNDRVAHTFNSSGTFSVGGVKTYTHNTLDIFGDSSCIALYKFDGNANDESGTYNGTASNVTYAQSYINDGSVFNGSSSRIQTPQHLTGNPTFSVSMWVYPTATGVFYANGAVTAGPLNNTLHIFYDGVNSQFRIGRYGLDFITHTGITGSLWYHIVVTGNGSTVNSYVNNGTVVSSNQTLSIGAGETNFGKLNGHEDYYFGGKLDQFRLFNKVLSTSEIATLYAE